MATILVTNLNDSGPGSLRAAITQANTGDTITFTVAGRIELLSALPTITNSITIDATGAPGYAGSPVVTIDGSKAGANADGLDITASGSNSTIEGLNIVNFGAAGIDLDGASNVTVEGNFIGANASGTAAAPNEIGIELQAGADNNTIGGTTAAAANVISGNIESGIDIDHSDSNTVTGNLIGTNAAGTAALANGDDGVLITDGSTGNTIGGTAAGAGNVISGNAANGVEIDGSSDTNIISGNLIGLDITGTSALGNGGAGIAINGSSDDNTIGGTVAGAGNAIADNAEAGVGIVSGVGNTIEGNAISQNDSGISLGVGANNEQSFPVLTDVTTSATQVDIAGMLGSTANQTFRIEFFASTAPDSQGIVEGATFLGSTSVTTNGAGNASFDTTLTANVAAGEFVTATATDVTTGDTSEFSQPFQAPTFVVTNLNDSGAGSLRQAILDANAAGGSNTITFDPSLAGKIDLANGSGPLDITSNVTIDGNFSANGTPDIAINAGGYSQVFDVSAGSSTLDGLVIEGGYTANNGGGVYVGSGATLTVIDSTLSNNSAYGQGGGIADFGNLTLIGSTLSDNKVVGIGGLGGGIDSAGSLALVNSTLSDDSATDGGGIADENGTVTLTNVTLSGNSAEFGGGIAGSGAALTLYDSTLTGNYASSSGGGIYNSNNLAQSATTTLVNSIAAGNDAGAGESDVNGNAQLTLTGGNIVGGTLSVDGTASQTGIALNDIFASVGPNPQTGVSSGVLNNNGGDVETVALRPGSVAIGDGVAADLPSDIYDLNNNGNTTEPLPVDARGAPRVSGGGLDLGAYQAQTPTNLVVTTLADDPYTPGSTYASILNAGNGLSLRQAIGLADAGGGSHTITFDPSLKGTLYLAQNYGALDITSNVTIDGNINGNGKPDITINAGGYSQVFYVSAGSSTLDGLTMTGGSGGAFGGAVEVGAKTGDAGVGLTISNSVITNNQAYLGSGIAVGYGDSLTLTNSTVFGNSAVDAGGGIFNYGGDLTLTDTTVSGNSAGYQGGGIANIGTGVGNSGELTLTNSTLSNNLITNGGGLGGLPSSGAGLFNTLEGHATLLNTTISDNTGADSGGGIDSSSYLALTNVTLSGNSALEGGGIYGNAAAVTVNDSTLTGNYASNSGGGIYNSGSTTLVNSIVSGNYTGAGESDVNGSASLTLTGGNIVGDTLSVDGTTSQTGIGLSDIFASVATNPYTGVSYAALANNGGLVPTVALNPTGVAINAGVAADLPPDTYDLNNNGNTTEPLPVDARGFDRVAGGGLDLGAFQQQAPQTFVVNTSSDVLNSTNPNATLADEEAGTGLLSLREALFLANEDPTTADTITFANNLSGGTIYLTLGQLKIDGSVTIDGGNDDITVNAEGNSRVFDDLSGTSTINGLTMTGGYAGGYRAGDGGAIQVGASKGYGGASLTISNSTITDNQAAYGGGIAVNAGDSLTLTNTTVSGNSAQYVGGGIANLGTLTLTNSTVSGNSSGYLGGGIANSYTGELTLTNSTLSGNQISGPGGPLGGPYTATAGAGAGLYNAGGATLSNTTISNNTGAYSGGGILNACGLTLTNSTVSANYALYAGGGILNVGDLTLTNSTVSGNQITGAATAPYGHSSAGAGLYNAGGAGLYNTTIANNTGASNGGGIYNSELLTLTNVTLADNSATNGGGLANAACGCGNATIYDSTVTGNDAAQSGGGINNAAGYVTLTNSIVAGNGAGAQGPDVYTSSATYTATSYSGVNLFSQAGVGRAGTDIYVSPSDLSAVFAGLTTMTPTTGSAFYAGTLANNGGPVETVLIIRGGEAQGVGIIADLPPDPNDPAVPLSTDARGDLRVVDGTLDLGALELQPPSSTTSTIAAKPTTQTADGTSTIALTVTVEDAYGDPLPGVTVTLSSTGSGDMFNGGANTIAVTTNAAGVAAATLTSTTAGPDTITATETTAQEITQVTFVAGVPTSATSSITATPGTVAANGSATTTVTVTIDDAFGNPVSGVSVTLSGSGSGNVFGNGGNTFSASTNASGQITTTLASTVAQTETITATEAGVVGDEKTSVTFFAQLPTITGTVANQATTDEAPIDPFSGVTIGDPNAGATDTLTITLASAGARLGTLSGSGLTGSDGTYQLSGSAATITAELDALSYTPVNGVPATSVTTTFDLSDLSSAFATPATDNTTSVIDTDLSAPPTPAINFPHANPSSVDEWILTDGEWVASAQPGSHPSGYEIAAVGDFTGSGTDGILWYDAATGDVDEWKMSNGAWAGSVDLGVHPNNLTDGDSYQIAGVGDFFDNGIDDVLWTSTNSNGTVATDIWELNSNGQWMASAQPGSHPAGYNVVGVGDFTGNGTSDILWQNPTTGDVDEWLINNGQWAGSVDLGSYANLGAKSGWTIAGIGDFTGNGSDDILWVNPNSGPNGDTQVDIWELGSNGQWTASVTPGLGLHPAGYQVAAVGNFTGNGVDGVLWYDPTTGNVDEWVLNSTGQWATSINLGVHPGSFQIAGTGAFVNGNSTSDILWHQTT